ncbi:hypothetical protein OH76DRAFT_799173 [Lentinus brumalis]|uniref:Uncharacterized protein n=1 Tax=Lentinus brumalis TaxID=2498619 RepID=A0A371D335_9APHY|nr:hypothetical protein OH76DRAFT_799173 [Polyporus brumalis]
MPGMRARHSESAIFSRVVARRCHVLGFLACAGGATSYLVVLGTCYATATGDCRRRSGWQGCGRSGRPAQGTAASGQFSELGRRNLLVAELPCSSSWLVSRKPGGRASPAWAGCYRHRRGLRPGRAGLQER